MDNEIRGILPDRILLTYFPLPFAGEIDGEQGKELLSLIEKNARQQLWKYVSAQEHSSVQCRQFLARKKYSAELIDTLLKEFQTKKNILMTNAMCKSSLLLLWNAKKANGQLS